MSEVDVVNIMVSLMNATPIMPVITVFLAASIAISLFRMLIGRD